MSQVLGVPTPSPTGDGVPPLPPVGVGCGVPKRVPIQNAARERGILHWNLAGALPTRL